jgi:methylamine--corrinoid protein Co-methyltransferase
MTTAYRHWEILERSQTGPFMDEDDFLPKHFTPTLKKLIKKYEIRYDPQKPLSHG